MNQNPVTTGVAARWCASNERWERAVEGSTGNTYTVKYGSLPGARDRMGYTCSCPGFIYRKQCRHINEVKDERCGLGWSAMRGEPVAMKDACPSCGDETRIVRIPSPEPVPAAAPGQRVQSRSRSGQRKAKPMVLINDPVRRQPRQQGESDESPDIPF